MLPNTASYSQAQTSTGYLHHCSPKVEPDLRAPCNEEDEGCSAPKNAYANIDLRPNFPQIEIKWRIKWTTGLPPNIGALCRYDSAASRSFTRPLSFYAAHATGLGGERSVSHSRQRIK